MAIVNRQLILVNINKSFSCPEYKILENIGIYKELIELRSIDKDTIKIKLSPYFSETNTLNISI